MPRHIPGAMRGGAPPCGHDSWYTTTTTTTYRDDSLMPDDIVADWDGILTEEDYDEYNAEPPFSPIEWNTVSNDLSQPQIWPNPPPHSNCRPCGASSPFKAKCETGGPCKGTGWSPGMPERNHVAWNGSTHPHKKWHFAFKHSNTGNDESDYYRHDPYGYDFLGGNSDSFAPWCASNPKGLYQFDWELDKVNPRVLGVLVHPYNEVLKNIYDVTMTNSNDLACQEMTNFGFHRKRPGDPYCEWYAAMNLWRTARTSVAMIGQSGENPRLSCRYWNAYTTRRDFWEMRDAVLNNTPYTGNADLINPDLAHRGGYMSGYRFNWQMKQFWPPNRKPRLQRRGHKRPDLHVQPSKQQRLIATKGLKSANAKRHPGIMFGVWGASRGGTPHYCQEPPAYAFRESMLEETFEDSVTPEFWPGDKNAYDLHNPKYENLPWPTPAAPPASWTQMKMWKKNSLRHPRYEDEEAANPTYYEKSLMGPVWSWDDLNVGMSVDNLLGLMTRYLPFNQQEIFARLFDSEWDRSTLSEGTNVSGNLYTGMPAQPSRVNDMRDPNMGGGPGPVANMWMDFYMGKYGMLVKHLCGEEAAGHKDYMHKSKCYYDKMASYERKLKDAGKSFKKQAPSGIYPITKTPLGYRAQCQHLKQKRSWWDWRDPYDKPSSYWEHKLNLLKIFEDKEPFPIHSPARTPSYGPSMGHDNLGYQIVDQLALTVNHHIMKRGTMTGNKPEDGYFGHVVMDTFNIKEKERIRENTTNSSWFYGIKDDLRSNYHFKADVPRGSWDEKTKDYKIAPMSSEDEFFCPSGLPGVRAPIDLDLRRHSYPMRVYKEFAGETFEEDQTPWYKPGAEPGVDGNDNWHTGDIQNEALTDPRHQYRNEPWRDVYVCNRSPNLDDTTGEHPEASLLCMEPGESGGFKGFEYLSMTTFNNVPETICRGAQTDREYVDMPELLHYSSYNPEWTDPVDLIEHDHNTNFWELSTVDNVVLPDWHADTAPALFWEGAEEAMKEPHAMDIVASFRSVPFSVFPEEPLMAANFRGFPLDWVGEESKNDWLSDFPYVQGRNHKVRSNNVQMGGSVRSRYPFWNKEIDPVWGKPTIKYPNQAGMFDQEFFDTVNLKKSTPPGKIIDNLGEKYLRYGDPDIPARL